MEHNRPVSDQDKNVFQLLCQYADKVVLTPIFVNGQPRQAFVLLVQAPDGSTYAQVLGICMNPNDSVLDLQGTPAFNVLPTVAKFLN